jgi:hypothetical protein
MTADQIKKLDEVHAAIVGNKTGNKGIIKRLEDLETYKEGDVNLKAKVAGGVFVGTPILVGIWHYILKFFQD